MHTSLSTPQLPETLPTGAIKQKVDGMIDDLFASLPDPKQLSVDERRGIIARYTAVLEANFIYWMTAALLSVQSEESRPILLDNLYEEIRDCHPAMLRRFAMAAHAFPTDSDALAVHDDLTKVRLFLGKLSGVQTVLTMGFFEGFIQRFMAYLEALATAQGSTEREYTEVHGVCDIAHSEGLFNALAIEMSIRPLEPGKDLFEGVYLLRNLIQTIVHPQADDVAA
jgi:Iron-containing redox enzyme